jgi:hypothetical protein
MVCFDINFDNKILNLVLHALIDLHFLNMCIFQGIKNIIETEKENTHQNSPLISQFSEIFYCPTLENVTFTTIVGIGRCLKSESRVN